MPWKESVAMDERLKFVRDALSDPSCWSPRARHTRTGARASS